MKYLPVAPAVLLIALTAGCGADAPAADGPAPARSPSVSPSSAAPSAPGAQSPGAQSPSAQSPSPPARTYADPADSPACAEVRDGIDAFNAGDLDGTVEHFEKAVPLAQAQADGSPAADDLLEAVRWYADLPAEDYPAASASSPQFAKYKVITLGQCGPVGEPSGSPTTPGEEV